MYYTKVRLVALTNIDFYVVGAKPTDSFIIKTPDGFGPPGVDLAISNTLYQGGVYQGRRPQARQFVFNIGLNPDWANGETAADLRTMLYGTLTGNLSDEVQVQFINVSDVVAQTSGYVSKLEPDIFSKDPSVQLTVDCLDSYLEAPDSKNVPILDGATSIDLTNEGSAPTGVHFEILFNANVSSWTVTDPNVTQKMTFTYPFISGDRLTVDTQPGVRGIYLMRNGVSLNIIKSLSVDSIWRTLTGGVNTLVGDQTEDYVWDVVRYQPKYWGV